MQIKVSRSTIADANEKRDWRIYADFAYLLIKEAKELYHDENLFNELNETIYALDSTTIDLCLSLFPWAKFRSTKSAIKIHNKQRWQIELFFKWLKQNLKIKSFYGNSFNAVKTQIWIAVSVYVLLALIKKKLKIEHSLYTFLQVISITIFEKTPIISMFSENNYKIFTNCSDNQLSLFNL